MYVLPVALYRFCAVEKMAVWTYFYPFRVVKIVKIVETVEIVERP